VSYWVNELLGYWGIEIIRDWNFMIFSILAILRLRMLSRSQAMQGFRPDGTAFSSLSILIAAVKIRRRIADLIKFEKIQIDNFYLLIFNP